MFKRSLVFAAGLLLGLVLAPGLHAQAREWVMPPNVVDFSTSPPTTHLLPALTQPTDPFQDPYRLANGAFDSGGKLLFYVRQGKSAPKLDVFDGSGKKIDQLAGASDSPQIYVVPVPLSCDQKYYIIYFTRVGNGHASLVLTYSVFDTQLGAITSTSRDVQVGPGRLPVTPGSYFGTTAVSPLRSGATRFLYAVNNDVVDKFLIDPSGISFANRLATSQSEYRPIQAVLSSDGSKLALGTPDGILVVTLDTQGDLGDSSVVTNPPVSGLAFSRDGSMLFFGDNNGIEYFRLDDPSTVVSLPDSGGYGNSQLELAVDDKIYAAGLNGDPDLGAIDPLGPIPSFTLTAVPGILGGNFPGVFSLPAQIAGEPICGNPALVQSSIGHQGNFELVVPDSCGGLAHYWRDNDNGNSWNGPNRFGADVGAVDAVSMIWSNYGHLEVVARIGDRLAHFWRDSTGKWIPPTTFFATGVSGTPSLVQGTFGIFPPGNFELVAPLAAGGIAHYWRDAQLNWYGDFIPSSAALPGPATDVSLIQSTLGVLGNDLQMTARVGDQLFAFSRNYMGIWSEPTLVVAAGASGTPSLIQGNFANPGGPGNFELVTPLAKGGMAHYWRDSSNYWHGPNPFADGNVRSVSLIQSNYGQDFEVVARRNCGLVHYSRSDAQASSPWTWSGATIIVP